MTTNPFYLFTPLTYVPATQDERNHYGRWIRKINKKIQDFVVHYNSILGVAALTTKEVKDLGAAVYDNLTIIHGVLFTVMWEAILCRETIERAEVTNYAAYDKNPSNELNSELLLSCKY